MSGEKPGPDSIEERIKKGDVRLDLWSSGADVQIWVFAALYVGLLCYGLLGGDGKPWLYLTVGALGAGPIWMFLAQRRPRAGRAIVLTSNEVRWEIDNTTLVSIPWDQLKGVTFKFTGMAVCAKDGDHFVVPEVEYGYKRKELQKSISKYLISRSCILTKERDVLPEPRPQSLLKRNIWIWASSSGILFVILSISGKNWTQEGLSPDEVMNGLALSLVLVVASAITCIFALRNWRELKLWDRRYEWDRDAPLPAVTPADTEQHRTDHRKNPPLVAMEEGKTYVHRNYPLGTDSLRLLVWFGLPMGALFLVAPWLGSLDGSIQVGGGVFFMFLAIFFPFGTFTISASVWSLYMLRPYLSKYTLSGDELVVEYKERTAIYPAKVVRKKRMWLWPSYFGGKWEVFGDASRTVLIDRRYLREMVEGERIDLR